MLHGVTTKEVKALALNPKYREAVEKTEHRLAGLIDQISHPPSYWKAHVEEASSVAHQVDLILNYQPELSCLVALKRSCLLGRVDNAANISSLGDVINDFILPELLTSRGLLRRHRKSYALWGYHVFLFKLVFAISYPDTHTPNQSDGLNGHEKTADTSHSCNANELAIYRPLIPVDPLLDHSSKLSVDRNVDHLGQIINSDVVLCAELLASDNRNYHVWNHIRFLYSLRARSGLRSPNECVEDLAFFANERLKESITNYSAWLTLLDCSMSPHMSPDESIPWSYFDSVWRKRSEDIIAMLALGEESAWALLVSRHELVYASSRTGEESSFESPSWKSYLDLMISELNEVKTLIDEDQNPDNHAEKERNRRFYRFLHQIQDDLGPQEWETIGMTSGLVHERLQAHDPILMRNILNYDTKYHN